MIPLKTTAEIEQMSVACAIAAEALELAGQAVKPGVSTAYIDKIVYDYIVGQNAKPSFKGYGGFPASACVSVNDTVIHGIPSKNIILNNGDIVSIDIGAFINGFHGDNAATFACGNISEKAQMLIDVTRKSRDLAIEIMHVGNRVGDIGAVVQNYVESAGYSVVRTFVGHGVGKNLHEAPEVPNYGTKGRGVRLVAGMTLAVEPMVNEKGYDVQTLSDKWTVKTLDGGLSAHFEHTVLISGKGPVILTKCRK